jgi:hypothetical protein
MTTRWSQSEPLEAALLARLPGLLTEVSAGLSEYWPDYAGFLEEDPEGMARASVLFVHHLFEIVEPDATHGEIGRNPDNETLHLVFEQIGRQQQRIGNDLPRLLTAFQLGARLAWQHVSDTALEMGLPPHALAALADAVFVFVNELSFSAARGFLEEEREDARARDRRREELADLLLSGRADDDAVRRAADGVGWRIPEKAAVVLVDPHDESARRLLDRLEPDTLPVRHRDMYGAIVPDPDLPSRRPRLLHQLRGAGAVVGYAVPLQRLPWSTEIARLATRLRHDGLIRGDLALAEDYLDTLIVWRDRGLIEALRGQVLAPLDNLSEGARARLIATLSSWLDHQGEVSAMAAELNIHAQTVRYRMAQLRELFGDDLDSARSRARLFLALQWPDV